MLLNLEANYVVEASNPTVVILFCVKFVNMLMICVNGRRFGAHEGLCAETSAIYINHQHLRAFYTKENYRGIAHLDYMISY